MVFELLRWCVDAGGCAAVDDGGHGTSEGDKADTEGADGSQIDHRDDKSC